VVTAEDVSGV